MKTMMKMVLGSFAACFALGAVAVDPTIGQVTVRQRWPWSRLVDIDYVLSCDPAQKVDIAFSAYNGSTALTLPAGSLSGDLYDISEGAHRIVFDPTRTAYTNSEVMTQFRVALTPTNVPLYMIVDLTNAVGTQAHVEYVYEADLRAGKWGSWVENPVSNKGTVVESVVWTGVATNDIYKTDKLVLRRIPAGNFQMGGTQNGATNVFLSKGMFAGVFEITEQQFKNVTGAAVLIEATRPRRWSTYDAFRGGTNGTPAIDWPSTGRHVSPTSLLGKLREQTGLTDFDLPTEAQWEYLCRAGTTTYFNDGIDGSADSQLNELGWWSGNGDSATHPVGQKKPNAWGLYDMHGNLAEWCLDWYAASGELELGTDPDGAVSGEKRMTRGGSYGSSAVQNTSAHRSLSRLPTDDWSGKVGGRVVITLP